MTVYGLRDDVKLIRENANGKQEIIPLDLNKVGLFSLLIIIYNRMISSM